MRKTYSYTPGSEFFTIPDDVKPLDLNDNQYEQAFDDLSQVLSDRMSLFIDDSVEAEHLYYLDEYNRPEKVRADQLTSLKGKKKMIDMAAAGRLFGYSTGKSKLTQIRIDSIDAGKVKYQCNTALTEVVTYEEKVRVAKDRQQLAARGLSTALAGNARRTMVDIAERIPEKPKVTFWMRVARFFGSKKYDEQFRALDEYKAAKAKYDTHYFDQQVVLNAFNTVQYERQLSLARMPDELEANKAAEKAFKEKAAAEGKKKAKYKAPASRKTRRENIRHRMLSDLRGKTEQYAECGRTVRAFEERSRITGERVSELTGKLAGADAKQKLDAAAEMLREASKQNPASVEGTAQMRAAFALYDSIGANETDKSAYEALGAEIKGFRATDEMLENGRRAEYELAKMVIDNEPQPKVTLDSEAVEAALEASYEKKPAEQKTAETAEEKKYYSKETVDPLVRDAMAGKKLAAMMHAAEGNKPEIIDTLAKSESVETAIETTRAALTGTLRTGALSEREPSEIVSELADSRVLDNFASKGKDLHVSFNEQFTDTYSFEKNSEPDSEMIHEEAPQNPSLA